MKRRVLDGFARSTCDYLCSRNNDINGYWGIGVLSRLALIKGRRQLRFRTVPGDAVHIFGCEISHSQPYTEVLRLRGVDSIEGRLSFFEDGRFPNGQERFSCGICLVLTADGKVGLHMIHVSCWPHDPSIEVRRSDSYRSSISTSSMRETDQSDVLEDGR